MYSVLSDKLFEHCAEINEAVETPHGADWPQLAKQYGVTEKLRIRWNGYGR